MSAEGTLSVKMRMVRPGGSFVVDVAFEAPPGVTILFGPSGAGKSSILGAVAGLLLPDEGTIRLGNETWFDAATGVHKAVRERKIAYVFQSLALFPHMTARANVEYGIDQRLPKEERARLARASLERFRVAHVEERKPRTFSGGEAQRVALARAFAMRPRVILLDEPFSAMDRDLRKEFAADVRRVADDLRVPVLHVTRHRTEARTIADQVLLIEGGRIRAAGRATTLIPADGEGEP